MSERENATEILDCYIDGEIKEIEDKILELSDNIRELVKEDLVLNLDSVKSKIVEKVLTRIQSALEVSMKDLTVEIEFLIKMTAI